MSETEGQEVQPSDAPVSRETFRIQASAAAIASNVAIDRRVAPDIAETSVIDDMYAFADHLRTGSGPR